MILLHRLTPFVLALILGAGFWLSVRMPQAPLAALTVSLALAFLLLGRLAGWQPRSGTFWNLVGAPFAFASAGTALFLLLETNAERALLAALVCMLVFAFAEQVFAYVHVPVTYQPYAIQHLSLGMNALTVFFFAAFSFGTRTFMQTPLWMSAPAMFVLSAYVLYQALWVSKMEHRRARVYGLCGGLIVTEVFLALSFFPTGIYVNAALTALTAYAFLGLSRAWFLEQTNRRLMARYVVAVAVSVLIILVTAQWL